MSYVSSLTSNLVHPIKYMQERGAKQAAQVVQFNTEVKTGTLTLTTSEKRILGRIADAIRVLFGMKGAPGSVADLKYCLNQLKKHVITQSNLALSHKDAPIEAFRQALSTRATLLKLPVSDKMMTAYARQMFKDALGETLDCKAVDALVKTIFTVDKKGYSKKAKVAMGIAAAVLISVAACQVTDQISKQNVISKGQETIRETCEKALATSSKARIACNACGWEKMTLPPLKKEDYTLVLDESGSDSHGTVCTAILNHPIPQSETCLEPWKIVFGEESSAKVRGVVWWDAVAKLSY